MKNILLTGDSKGLGENIKRKLLDSGYNVIGLSRSSCDIQYDLSNLDGVKDLYLNIIKERGPIHGFVKGYRAEDRFFPADEKITICGAFIETDDKTGLSVKIEPFQI